MEGQKISAKIETAAGANTETEVYEDDNGNFVLDLIRSEKLLSAGPAIYYNADRD